MSEAKGLTRRSGGTTRLNKDGKTVAAPAVPDNFEPRRARLDALDAAIKARREAGEDEEKFIKPLADEADDLRQSLSKKKAVTEASDDANA